MVYKVDHTVRRESRRAVSHDSATNSSPSPSPPPQQHAPVAPAGPTDYMEEPSYASATSRSSRSSPVKATSSGTFFRESHRLVPRPSPFLDTDSHMTDTASVGAESRVTEYSDAHQLPRGSGSGQARVWSKAGQYLEARVIQPRPPSFPGVHLRTAHTTSVAPEDSNEERVHSDEPSRSGRSSQVRATSSAVLYRETTGRQSPAASQPAMSVPHEFQVDAAQLSRIARHTYHELSINLRIPFAIATANLKRRSLALYEFLLDLQGCFKLSAGAMLLAYPLTEFDGEFNSRPDDMLSEEISSQMPSSALLESLWANVIGAMEMAVPSMDEAEYEQLALDFEDAVQVFRQANASDLLDHVRPEGIGQRRLATGVKKVKDALDEIEPVMEALIDKYGLLIGILSDLLEVHTMCAKLESLWCSPATDDSHEWDT